MNHATTRQTLALFTMLFIVGACLSQTAKVTLKITNIENTRGVIEIGLYKNNGRFPKPGKQYRKVRIKPKSSTLTYTFKDLPHGKYAFAIYHDENGDGTCNRNMFFYPTEAYAFSRNFRPRWSAPDFEDCSFSVRSDKGVSIKMVY